MASVAGAWTEKTVNGLWRATCNVVYTSVRDAYTLKTPDNLDSSRSWQLIISAAATPDGSAVPLDLWVGHDTDFVLSGDNPTVATNGGLFVQLTDDINLAVTTIEHIFLLDPYLAVADVVTIAAIATGYKVKVPIAPYYAIALNGATTMATTNNDFTIVQSARGVQVPINR